SLLVPTDALSTSCSSPWQLDLEVLFKGDSAAGSRRSMLGLSDEESAQLLLTTSGDAKLGLKSSASLNEEAEIAASTGRLPRHRWVNLTVRLSTNSDGSDTVWLLLVDGVPSARAPTTTPPLLIGPLRVTWLLGKNDTSTVVRNTFVTSSCNATPERLVGGANWPYFDNCVGKSNNCPVGCECRATDGDNVCSCPKATAGCPQERYSLRFASPSLSNASFDVFGDGVTFLASPALTEGANYLTLRPSAAGQSRCLANGACASCGFYIRLVFKTGLGHQDFALLYAGTLGLSVGVDSSNRLIASLVSKDAEGRWYRWTVAGGVVAENEWSLAEIAWHPAMAGGLRLELNGHRVGQSTGTEMSAALPWESQPKDWYLGRDPVSPAKPIIEDKKLTVLSLLALSADGKTIMEAKNSSSLGGAVHMVSVSFENDVESGYMLHFSFPAGIRVEDGVQRVPGVFGRALRLPGSTNSFVKIQAGHSCLTDLQWCHQGLTVRLWLRPLGGSVSGGESILLSARGYEVVIQSARLIVRARTDESVWVSRGQRLTFNAWQLIEFSWERRQGLQVYINGSLVDSMAVPTADFSTKAGLSADTAIYLGSAVNVRGRSSPNCDIDELQLWEASRDELIARRKLTLVVEPNAYIWDGIARHRFVGGTASPSVQAVVRGYPRVETAPPGMGTGLRMSLDRDSIVFNENIVCLGDPLNYCPEGFAMVLPLKFEGPVSNVPIISSDTLEVSADATRLIVQFRLSRHIWKAALPASRIPDGTWFVMSISWQLHEGLLVYINDALVTSAYQAGLHDARDAGEELIVGSNPRFAYTRQVMHIGTITWWNARYSYVLNRAALRMRTDYPAVNIIDGPGNYQNQQPATPVQMARIGRSGQIIYRFSGVPDNYDQSLNLTFATRERNALLWHSFREPNTTITVFLKDGNLKIVYERVEDSRSSVAAISHTTKEEITVKLDSMNIADGYPHNVFIQKLGDTLDITIDRRGFERHRVSNEGFWLVPDRGMVHVAEHRALPEYPGFVGDLSGLYVRVGSRLRWNLLENIGGRNPRPDVPFSINGDVRIVYERPPPPDRGSSGGSGGSTGGGSPGSGGVRPGG
uniref:LAM_G_DOMAIN domain-containing protein n=1 Tax=Macrostomum lignano TaxID=282301 RepID=A0A1I8GLK0_9PLAT